MIRRPAASVLAAAASVVLVLTGCSGGESDQSARPSPSASASAGPDAATPPQRPRERACYRLDYAEAVAPTLAVPATPCSRKHTSMTYAVGALDTVVDGHLLAVDSQRVRDRVAQTCPERFDRFVGGTTQDRRLSMLRPVWFTPTVEESDAGSSWYRCEVVALAADERLAPLTGRLQGVLDRADSRDRYAMCGTAEPGTAGFERVICTGVHAWRAVETVPFTGRRYPGVATARAAGEAPCQDAGAAAADGALDYRWGYEWPSAAQWRAGQRYGICWAPD